MQEKQNIQNNIKEILQYIGEDINRDGLVDTPKRVQKALDEIFSGYKDDVDNILKSALFDSDNNNMIVVNNIDFYSTCEHHMLPVIGKAYVGYIPNNKVVGLSKIPRIVNSYAKRLQIQENMTKQIADAIYKNINPKGVGVVIKAKHLCMEMRGVNKINSLTSTYSYNGNFTDENIKQEFLSQITSNGS